MFEPVSQLTMDAITSITGTMALAGFFWMVLYDEAQGLKNFQVEERPEPRPYAEKVLSKLHGMSFVMAQLMIADTEVALCGRRVSDNPTVQKLLDILAPLPVGTACEATRIVTTELAQRPWRTI